MKLQLNSHRAVECSDTVLEASGLRHIESFIATREVLFVYSPLVYLPISVNPPSIIG